MMKMKYPPHNDSAKFFKMTTWEVDEILDYISFNLRKDKIKMVFKEPNDETQLKIGREWFWTRNRTSLGRCFSFKVPKWIQNKKATYYILSKVKPSLSIMAFQIMSISFMTKIPAYVYVHYPGHYYHPDSQSKISLIKSTRHWAQLNYEITNTLPRKGKKSCRQYPDNYTLDDCFIDVCHTGCPGSIFHFLRVYYSTTIHFLPNIGKVRMRLRGEHIL